MQFIVEKSVTFLKSAEQLIISEIICLSICNIMIFKLLKMKSHF